MELPRIINKKKSLLYLKEMRLWTILFDFPRYQFVFNGVYQGSPVLNTATAQIYSVEVIDHNMCSSSNTLEVPITQNDGRHNLFSLEFNLNISIFYCFNVILVLIISIALSLVVTPSPAVCHGSATGTAQAVIAGGTGSYFYNLTSVSSLFSPVYGLTTLPEPGSTVTATLTTLNASSYLILNVFVLFCFVLFCFVLFCFVLFCFVLFCFVLFCFVNTIFFFEELIRYHFSINDTNGCLMSRDFTITEPSLLTAAVTSTPVTCKGQSDGNIQNKGEGEGRRRERRREQSIART